ALLRCSLPHGAEAHRLLRSCPSRRSSDLSFLRFRSATVSYTFNRGSLIDRIGMSNLRLYVTGENFYTWTRYLGQDPEVNMESGIFGVARDKSRTPPTMRFTFGLSTSF